MTLDFDTYFKTQLKSEARMIKDMRFCDQEMYQQIGWKCFYRNWILPKTLI